MSKKSLIVLVGMLALLIASTGFSDTKILKGTVKVDGSSTVFPITEAVAEEFGKVREHRRIRVTVGVSGTGGGFKKFLAGETDINDASRPIKQREIDIARKNGIQYIELPVAYDGLSVVVNKSNTWVDYLTVAELHKIWKPGSTVKTWKDIRSNWPDKKIQLYGPGTDSGTFDYFTEVINGKSQVSRSDFTKSEDDNVLVTGVAGDKGSLGYFGFAYYVENKDKLKVVPIKQGSKKPVAPTMTTINNGSYAPLSRPIFIYVNLKSAKKPEVREFVRFYLKQAKELVKEVGYVPLPDQNYQKHLDKFENNFLKLAKR
jgi:phosphate transport system substrate-binding protein